MSSVMVDCKPAEKIQYIEKRGRKKGRETCASKHQHPASSTIPRVESSMLSWASQIILHACLHQNSENLNQLRQRDYCGPLSFDFDGYMSLSASLWLQFVPLSLNVLLCFSMWRPLRKRILFLYFKLGFWEFTLITMRRFILFFLGTT